MPMVSKRTSRKFAIVAVMSRPRTLTVMLSPSFSPISAAASAEKLISGGPA